MRTIGALIVAVAATLAGCGFGQAGPAVEAGFPNSGAPAAQEAFHRGLALLHNFEYAAAASAFREAQSDDPGFAMAFWGEAMTANHPVWMEQDREAAVAILGRLGPTPEARRARAGTDRERAYLEAVERLFGNGPKEARDRAYAEAMRRVHERYPDDADAAAFYALALLGTAHEGRDTATYMRAAAVVEDVFRASPDHPGGLHYLIHAYDDPVHAPLGLRAARRYAGVAPSAPHAQHMTSHIFLAMGLWDDVVAANERAASVMNDGRRSRGQPPRACGHYTAWLLYGYVQQGRLGAARERLDACRAEAMGERGRTLSSSEADPLDPDNTSAASFVQMWARYLIDSGDWGGEVARWDVPLADLAGARLTQAFAAALGAATRGDLTEARGRLEALDLARSSLDDVLAARGAPGGRYAGRARAFDHQVRGLLLVAGGQVEPGLERLREAASIEASLPFEFGPPFFDKPTHELLGEVLLSADRPVEAQQAFERALGRTPGRATALHGLARSLAATGASERAAALYAGLLRAWHRADQIPDDVRRGAEGAQRRP